MDVKEGGRSVEFSGDGRDSVQTNKARHKEMEDVDRPTEQGDLFWAMINLSS